MAKKSKKAGKRKAVKALNPIEKKLLAQKTVCPACKVEINLGDRIVGQTVECPECGAELEVVQKGTKLDVEYIEHEEEKEDTEQPEMEDYE